jgi:hypothetical protein
MAQHPANAGGASDRFREYLEIKAAGDNALGF